MDTGEITLIQDWNWYAGSDPSAIAAGQYSFATTVTHELGHALNLGHSSELNSPMYATLPADTVKGGLIVADLALPMLDTTNADALHAAGFGSAPSPVTIAARASNSGILMGASSGVSSPASEPSLAPFFDDLTRMLANSMTLYQSTLASFASLWQRADNLFVQRFDALLSMGTGPETNSHSWSRRCNR